MDARSKEKVGRAMTRTRYSRMSALSQVLLCVLILASPVFGDPSGGTAASWTPSSYNLGDTLFLSAIGKNKTPFTPLSLWNFGEGWLVPWVPPPNGELHLQRGGWVNTAS